MIKLTLNPDFHPTTLTFHKSSVTIGSSKASEVDLVIPDEQLQEVHVKIVEQEGKFFVINEANDPFVALNDRPFGKKEIKTGDQLSIRDDIVLFEGKAGQSAEPVKPEILKEVEQAAKKPWHPEKFPMIKSDSSKWSKMAIALSVVFLLALLITGGVYLNLSAKSEEEEIQAAVGVADVAMALTYAKLNQETPQKMNWSDHNFLNRFLTDIAPPQQPGATVIESNGRFKESPFFVRIYSNGDLSHFLVIAQPVPSKLHWFIPQRTILLDSHSMELKRTKGVKDINRLLANMDEFEGAKAEEISNFIEHEQPIPLSKVVLKGGNKGFAVPSLLAEERPGSENLVYNAPRYFNMGEAILEQARHLLESSSNSKEILQLKGQIEFISNLPDFVFYSSKGKGVALEGLRALATVDPHQDYLVGYLKVNDRGLIEQVNLINDEDKSLVIKENPEELIAEQSSQIVLNGVGKTLPLFEIANEKVSTNLDLFNFVVDGNHPLFLKLKALAVTREQTLHMISQEMVDRLKKHNNQPQSNFLPLFQEQLVRYDQENSEQQQKIIQEILLLNQKFCSIPFTEFLSYVRAAGLISYLKEYQSQSESNILSKEELERYLAEIQKAANLLELDQVATELSSLLTLKNVPEYETLIVFQNAVSYHILQKLSHFLLKTTEVKAQENGRELILHILKTSWISDPDVVEYYLNEHEQIP